METTYGKIYDALDPIEKWSMDLDFDREPISHSTGSKRRTTNLRFDVEVAESLSKRSQLYQVWAAVKLDLVELLTYGDVNEPQDTFLRMLDGELVRGKRVKTFEISHAVLYRTHKPNKATYEYTVYLVVYVDY